VQENYLNLWSKLTNNFKCLFFKKLFRSKGRASRKEYIVGLLIFIIVIFGGDKTNDYFHKSSSLIMFFLSQVSFAICVIYAVNYFFIMARRLHDLNISGWWQLITFVPCGQLLMIGLIFFKGTPGPNKYGEPPVD
jgi:uncharacterized membrane protein YhaH (DUF805 family)